MGASIVCALAFVKSFLWGFWASSRERGDDVEIMDDAPAGAVVERLSSDLGLLASEVLPLLHFHAWRAAN